jgi:hypothetical protein
MLLCAAQFTQQQLASFLVAYAGRVASVHQDTEVSAMLYCWLIWSSQAFGGAPRGQRWQLIQAPAH